MSLFPKTAKFSLKPFLHLTVNSLVYVLGVTIYNYNWSKILISCTNNMSPKIPVTYEYPFLVNLLIPTQRDFTLNTALDMIFLAQCDSWNIPNKYESTHK